MRGDGAVAGHVQAFEAHAVGEPERDAVEDAGAGQQLAGDELVAQGGHGIPPGRFRLRATLAWPPGRGNRIGPSLLGRAAPRRPGLGARGWIGWDSWGARGGERVRI